MSASESARARAADADSSASSMGPWLQSPTAFAGRLESWRIESAVLRGNRAGDPHVRELLLYVPPGARERGLELPLVFVLAGFTGQGRKYVETHPWKRGWVLDYDRGVAAGRHPRAVLALVDCFTRLGGSQYVNSSYLGRYEDHLAEELVPWVEAHAPVQRGARAVIGKSSGGFGALHLALARPGLFRAVASLSGDACFELAYGNDLLACLRGLVPHAMDPARFLAEFERRPKLAGDAHAVLNVLAMSACYSPAPETPLGFELPMDLATGERRPEVWKRWLAFDPYERAGGGAAALKALELLYVECGLLDECHLQWATRRLARRFAELGIPHRHAEHPAGHMDIDERFLAVLPQLVAALEQPRPRA